ncbi:uncharacterized protein GIQ15_05088 [Arthroderma uncinatum]|uniref:uncharacterized protein n=1 Tax=Arthroderma uncinatum TaxID=74035 RepID=UPI00144A6F9A|nr:uncharacterized protein GIQ15_05088 [Arthroderma uncinatum]KAF3482329.1 hypothetical protein GIQ15_05088 [Arthroderma uncinatum]
MGGRRETRLDQAQVQPKHPTMRLAIQIIQVSGGAVNSCTAECCVSQHRQAVSISYWSPKIRDDSFTDKGRRYTGDTTRNSGIPETGGDLYSGTGPTEKPALQTGDSNGYTEEPGERFDITPLVDIIVLYTTVSSSPQTEPEEEPEPSIDEIDELDREPPIPPPRLSLPLNEMTIVQDDNSPDIPAPRLSLLPDDEDVTRGSIEMPRRERSARDLARLSRVSFASNRFSDHFGDTTNIVEDTEEGLDFGVGQEDYIDEDVDNTTGQAMLDAGGETEDLGRFNLDFAFPTPEAPHHVPAENTIDNEQDTFELDAVPPEFGGPDSPSSQSDFGAVGFEPAADEQSSKRGTPMTEIEEEVQPEEPQKKKQKVSKHGIPVPSLPVGVVKKLAMRFARSGNKNKTRITKDTMTAIQQATDWFFEQASGDLSTYSDHSGRKTIDETDVIALMRRQRHVGKSASVFALAQKHLPKELLQDIRLPKS